MINRLLDVFKSLEKNKVRYLVIGGIAAVLYGVPRATFDLDIIIDSTEDNAERLLKAFLDAELGTAALTSPQDIISNEITVFSDIVQIDVQTSSPGLDFSKAWKNREIMSFNKQKFCVVSKEHLIDSEKAAGRKVDLEDVRLLKSGTDTDKQNQ